MNHSLYQDGILKALPFKRLPCLSKDQVIEIYSDMVLKGLAWTPAQSGGRRPQTDVVSVA